MEEIRQNLWAKGSTDLLPVRGVLSSLALLMMAPCDYLQLAHLTKRGAVTSNVWESTAAVHIFGFLRNHEYMHYATHSFVVPFSCMTAY